MATMTMDAARESVSDLQAERWLKPEEVAFLLGYSRAKTYQLLAEKEIPSTKDRGSRRVALADLRAYQARKRAESGNA